MNKKNQINIFIVEDNEVFRLALKANIENFFANKPIKIHSFETGEACIEKFKKEKPSAVMLDILMPGMDGLEVLKKIRERDSKVPVFMITAFSNEERFKQANSYNASGFIVKTSDLNSEIQSIISAINIADGFKGK